MTEDRPEDVGGKGFAPTQSNIEETDDETTATSTHGSGKQFAPDVGDPGTDPAARQTEGSGKQFARDVHETPEEADEVATHGSGKQFAPEREDDEA